MIRRLILPAILIVVVLFCGVNTSYASDPPEYQLAIINAGGYVPNDHITVARFRSLLNQLSSTYGENQQRIADMSAKSQDLLRKEGIEESLLKIMEGLNQLFSGSTANQKYSDCLSAYITLRVKGASHTEAIRGIQAIFGSLGVR